MSDMKILQVIASLRTGGAEKLIVDMVPKYREYGLDVDVLLFDGTETPFKRQLENAGVKVYSLGCGGSVYNPLYIPRLLSYLRRYDIVHTHTTAPQLFAAVGSVLCSVVLCTTEHNTSNRRRRLTYYRPIDKWMYSRYKEVISISKAATEELARHVEIKCPITTIPNGIDVNKYTEACAVDKRDLGCREDSFLLMMVAGFRNQKDQDTIIRAMQLLPETVQLCLVGDGERKKECEELAVKCGVAGRVIFTGIRTDVPNVLKAADVVVMSSHYEGFGLAAVEGLAAGKPVVVSDVRGLSDIVREHGILFPNQDAKALANSINHLMTDRYFYSQIASRCRARASDFDISKTVDGYVGVYRRLMMAD